MHKFFYVLFTVTNFFIKQRSLLAFGLVLLGVISADVIFSRFLFEAYAGFVQIAFPDLFQPATGLDVSFAPEVWLSLIELALGTLIIVISIASQSTPKLIDIYMQDWFSLIYIWFLIISGAQTVVINLYSQSKVSSSSSLVLNAYFFLPVAIVLGFPYVFYILNATQPNMVIKKIHDKQLRQIHSLSHMTSQKLLHVKAYVERYQWRLFESLNQLDNILDFVCLKEPKAQIIQNITTLVQEYISIKPLINSHFFQVSPKIHDDISFKTLIDQFDEMEQTQTFYEQKCFRLLGNAYIQFLEQGEFDLASLCGSAMSGISLTALQQADDKLIGVIIVRFNTMLRFALKHGVKNNEARNLYNLLFHYRNFIENLVKFGKIEYSKQSFFYLRTYGTEAFKLGRTSPAMYFIVDVFAAEMKRILILVYQYDWDLRVQEELLQEMLQVDSPPEANINDINRSELINNGVRALQIALGLFYLKVGLSGFVCRIIDDILDDLEILGETTFKQVIDFTCDRLKSYQPSFWEDTDRGNSNLYYTPDQEQIEPFRTLIYQQMVARLQP